MKFLNRFTRTVKASSTSTKASRGRTVHHVHNDAAAVPVEQWKKKRKQNQKEVERNLKLAKKEAAKKDKSTNKSAKKDFARSEQAIAQERAQWHRLASIGMASFLLCTTALLSYQLIQWTKDWLAQPVLVVDVEGDFKYLDKQSITDIVNDALQEGYLQTDLPQLHGLLAAEPWVKNALLKRQLDNGLLIKLYEHKPLAMWNDKSLISEEGVLYTPRSKPDLLLPSLQGHDYQLALAQYQELSELLPEYLLPIRQFSQLPDESMSFQLKGGVTVILSQQHWQGQLGRFLIINQQALAHRLADVEKVDMRYSNGAAVSWKEQSLAQVKQ